ncbi:RT0821/Lpp0805 family surface protein [Bradyrhizobium sp. LHD-71]|uniref:RT0821/Lpp0805 family surface protein n=1 Tax=Bradyrhizobium sp. LHD-71 TaxID=3072141 RepID=UPI002810437E|nr:RT0821/Lpp0805 family surface protein [Bradyrhizobium sp. LHD-71]MDQ8728575.1 RT0821/Lpp0805 family surface protein [Bradyrhizobium sp. LHD-71]
MLKFKAGLFAVGALALGGCANDPYGQTGPREGAGTALGALTGALVGSAFGGGTGERVGAAVAGAAIGGLIGNRIGASLDEEDRRYAYEAEMSALEQGQVGAPVGWRNPGSGRYGNIVPGPVYVERGARCRSYTHTVYIGGRPEVVRGTACRNGDGSWTAVS